MIKRGVRENAEDEILKVAVMRYGNNQWLGLSDSTR